MKRYVCVGKLVAFSHLYDRENPKQSGRVYEYEPMEIGWCKMMKLLKKYHKIRIFKTRDEASEYCEMLNLRGRD